MFAFLSDLENHWLLADRFIDVVGLDREASGGPVRGGRVRMHGPLRTRRTAATRVVAAEPPGSMSGTAELSGGTEARIRWTFAPDANGTRVRLAANVERAGLLDRLMLAAGGSVWLRHRFAKILEMLAAHFARSGAERAGGSLSSVDRRRGGGA